MTDLNCPRCGAWLTTGVTHISDTAEGLYVVVSEPVTDHTIACRCGCDVAVTSTQQIVHHPSQLTLIQGAA